MATSALIRLAQITALVAFLVVLFTKSYEFLQPQIVGVEGFSPTAAPAAPTRAADCRCLPGYVPSNSKKAGEITLDPRGWGFLLEGDKKYVYWWNMYGLDFTWTNTKWRRVSNEELANYKDGGNATKEQIQNARKYQGAMIESPNYFCQSLAEPSKTRQCY